MSPTIEAVPEIVELDREGTPAELDGLAEEWTTLCERVADVSYFRTPDWALSWWSRMESSPGRLVLWRDPRGDLAAIVALARHRERLHSRVPVTASAWRLMGSGPANSDHLGPVAIPDAWPAVVDWLRRRAPGTLFLEHLDRGVAGRVEPLTGATVVLRTRCPRLDVSDGSAIPGPFAKKLRQYLRRLDREGVAFEWVGPGAVDQQLLTDLSTLHEARWELKSGRRSTHLRDRIPFFEALTARSTSERGPVAVRATKDGNTVGMLLGFWYRGTLSYFQTGWDPEWKQLSLGTVLVERAIHFAMERGAATFDFLRGTDDYKYRFGAVDLIDDSIIVPVGPSGRLLRWKYTRGRELARRQGPIRRS